jgi:hypothetical protein
VNKYINKYSNLLDTPEVETEEEKRRRQEEEKLQAMQQTFVPQEEEEEPVEADDRDIPETTIEEDVDIETIAEKTPVQPISKPILPEKKPTGKGSSYYLNLYSKNIDTPFINESFAEEISTSEKTELGARLEKTTLRNFYNLAKAGTLTLTNDKSFSDNVRTVEKERTDKIYKELESKYGKDFRNVKEDVAVMAGRAVVAFADPVTFFIPWAKIAKVGKLGATGIGAGIASTDMALYDYATNGEVSPSNVLFAAGLGGASSFAGTLISNKLYAPKDKDINLGKINDSPTDVVVKSSIKDEEVVRLTTKEAAQLEEVSYKVGAENDALIKQMGSSVHLASGLKRANQDIYNFQQAEKLLKKVVDKDGYRVTTQLDLIENGTKISKADQYKLAGISPQKFAALKKKFEDAKYFKAETLPQLLMETSRGQVKILDDTFTKLGRSKEYELTENIMTGILQNFTRPLLGGGIGFTIGTFVGDEDEDTLPISFMMAGAGLGMAQRAIQKNPYITESLKQSGESYLKNAQLIALHNFLKTSTAGGLSTRLVAHGDELETLGRSLFHVQDGKVRNIIGAEQAADSMSTYFYKRAEEVLQNASKVEQTAAFKIINGLDTEQNIIKTLKLNNNEMTNVRTLIKNIDIFKREYGVDYVRSAGIEYEKLLNYGLPQFYNSQIISDPTGFKAAIRKAVKVESSKALERIKISQGDDAMKASLKKRVDDIFDNMTGRGAKNLFGDDEKFTGIPLLKNFEKKRYFQSNEARKILEPYLEDNLHEVLGTWIKQGTRGVEFARKFGQRGELVMKLKSELRKKLNDGQLTQSQYNDKQKLLVNSVNAYFKTYGISTGMHDAHKTGMALLTFMSNTTMLPRAAIAQLGDFIQPFQNSSLGAVAKGVFAGLNKDTNYAYQLGIARNRSTTLEKDIESLYSAAVNPYTKLQVGLAEATRTFFKYNGMAPLTDKGARFAFNVGIIDAFDLAKKYGNAKTISRTVNNKIKQMGLDKAELQALSKFNKVDDALKSELGLGILLKAGNKVKDRDLGVPTVGNRMLFAQSQNPYVRSLGLFLSWAQYKSAQFNSLINRVEDGDMKLAMKMLGAVTIFGGVRELQIMASPAQKYYEEHEPKNFSPRWWQEAAMLSGSVDWRIEKFSRFFAGPSQQSPVLNLTPVLAQADALLKAPPKIIKNFEEGDIEGAIIQAAKPTPFKELINIYNRIADEPLEDKPKERESQKASRYNLATGGRVNYVTGQMVSPQFPVTDATENPSERTDPLTGLTYAEQMEGLGFK